METFFSIFNYCSATRVLDNKNVDNSIRKINSAPLLAHSVLSKEYYREYLRHMYLERWIQGNPDIKHFVSNASLAV